MLDEANSKQIDPQQDVTVTTAAIPGASVLVKQGTLMNQQGTAFQGMLSITEVPSDLTPVALPANLLPNVVVTIQPGEMAFATPAPLSLPNRGGQLPGTQLDLWSINPTTGAFEKVGKGTVSGTAASSKPPRAAFGTQAGISSGLVLHRQTLLDLIRPIRPPNPRAVGPVHATRPAVLLTLWSNCTPGRSASGMIS